AKVFDPFFTTKDPDKGTGLGLAISRTIVEESDGQLILESTPDQGTRATVVLPIAEIVRV
ncbi:MAG: HAMP domain-containing histidine kinase, partial [Gemmatimonadetes bacterium]|nr:HAMP domain-containing histidine kinase [Gemmatimonadota bacterium]